MDNLKVLSLFSGIGAFEKALKNQNINYDLINYCEIDKHASKAYSLIHNEPETKNLGDITKVNEKELMDFDIMTWGFPCQDISVAGKQKGIIQGETRSGLYYDGLRILQEKKPKYSIIENVKALTQKKFQYEFHQILNDLNQAGYNNYYTILNAKNYGIPQNRERVFIVSIRKDIDHNNFKFPLGFDNKIKLKDMLEENVSNQYYLTDKMFTYVLDLNEKQKGTKWEGRANNDFINPDIAHTLSVRGIKGQRAGVSNIISLTEKKPIKVIDYKNKLINKNNNKDLRNLTEKECFRLMGFDDTDFERLSQANFKSGSLYKMAGNSIVVNVIEHIIKELLVIQ